VTLHPNARLTPYAREQLVHRVCRLGWTVAAAAQAVGVSERTGYRWLARDREGGEARFQDRPSRPGHVPGRTSASRQRRIERLRRRRMTAAQIALRLGMPRSTVSAVLGRLGLRRLRSLEAKPPVRRYERQRPGELLHLDTKKLGRIRGIGHRIHGDRRRASRGVGWEFAHVCVDDHSRLAYVEVLPDEGQVHTAAFLQRAIRWFRQRGVRSERLLTDNGNGYRSTRFRKACAELGLRHLFTRPYTPRTNGKAERFIQTLLREWAYVRPYRTSNQRTRRLPSWLDHYNRQRPHTALGYRPPISRIRRIR
jgi:transposase InsO family protein